MACKEILYLTSEKRMIRVICRDENIEYYGKLSNEIKKLPNRFLQIHHSFVINRNAV
ncbi:MAG: LytTR family transcriptional regulator DNA-binding domain-containing protein [Acetatifactor sp.]